MFWVPCPVCDENACRVDQQCCGHCRIRIENAMSRERARWDAYADIGVRQLELYLARHAQFAAWLAANGRP